jgi:hypothetical protein
MQLICSFRLRKTQKLYSALKAFMDQNNMKPDSIWLDIEQGSSCTWRDASGNRAFYSGLVAAGKRVFGAKLGIYSSRYMWGL